MKNGGLLCKWFTVQMGSISEACCQRPAFDRSPLVARVLRAPASTLQQHVLPALGCPTTMTPCRTRMVSYSSATFCVKAGTGCSCMCVMLAVTAEGEHEEA